MKTKQTKEENKKMKRFVRIQSNKTIVVTPGLQSVNVTNKDAHVENRLKVNSMWQNASVKIMAGVGYYPACVKNWNAVKKLEELEVLSIGVETDTIEDEGLRTVAEAIEKKLNAADARYKSQLDATMNDPLADEKEVKKAKAKKSLGMLKSEPVELVREGMEVKGE